MANVTATATAGDTTLESIVASILRHTQPELILLFGSRAYGSPREDSDYDLMLVIRDPASVESARLAACDAVREVGVSADIVAVSVDDYQRQQDDPGLFPFLISRQGRVLYATGLVPQRLASPGRVSEPRGEEGLAMWIKRANSDLRAAEDLLSAADPSWDAICFHSHGCVEKLFKALVVRAGTFPPRTHELGDLLTLQPLPISNDEMLRVACKLLMDLYPRSRYGPLPEPTPDEARQAIAAARQVRALLLPWLQR
jgi:HEPN domain-containing protein